MGKDVENDKIIYQDFGEMIFTHFGISGPIVLSSSAHLTRYKNCNEKIKNKKIKFIIDLKPALTEEKLNDRILRDFEDFKNKNFKLILENKDWKDLGFQPKGQTLGTILLTLTASWWVVLSPF